MNYSKALVESLEAAQLLAGHFATDSLFRIVASVDGSG